MLSRGRSLAVALLACGVGTLRAAESPPVPELKELLAGMDRASRLYLDTALRFTCNETITQGFHTSRYRYIFVYDDKKGHQDYRTRAGAGGGASAVNPSEDGFRFLERSYFWVLSFNAKRQKKHHYIILGKEAWNGIDAILLRFEPIPPYREGINDWFGTAWVDPASFQILKVEAMRADYKTLWDQMLDQQVYPEETSLAITGNTTTIQKVSTEFKSLKNGMRFPSRSWIVQTRYEPSGVGPKAYGVRVAEEDTVQTYRRYRFYGVRTEEEVRSILAPPRRRRN
jgi:hypothetical protein